MNAEAIERIRLAASAYLHADPEPFLCLDDRHGTPCRYRDCGACHEEGCEPLTARTFQTTDSTLVQRNGEPVHVVRAIRRADEDHDREVLPMYVVRFHDGTTAEAWRDELRP